MSTFLEIIGTLSLKDVPEVWIILSRLEAILLPSCGSRGLQLSDSTDGVIVVEFDFAGECCGTSATTVERDLAALSGFTSPAACLTVGWDNIREKQFFGPPEDVAVLKSRLALEEILRLRDVLLSADRLLAAKLLLSVSP